MNQLLEDEGRLEIAEPRSWEQEDIGDLPSCSQNKGYLCVEGPTGVATKRGRVMAPDEAEPARRGESPCGGRDRQSGQHRGLMGDLAWLFL